jgi:hypothetical protein
MKILGLEFVEAPLTNTGECIECVYILVYKGEIVRVGETSNWHQRRGGYLIQHPDWIWDSAFFHVTLGLSKIDREALEYAIINEFKPIYNTRYYSREVVWGLGEVLDIPADCFPILYTSKIEMQIARNFVTRFHTIYKQLTGKDANPNSVGYNIRKNGNESRIYIPSLTNKKLLPKDRVEEKVFTDGFDNYKTSFRKFCSEHNFPIVSDYSGSRKKLKGVRVNSAPLIITLLKLGWMLGFERNNEKIFSNIPEYKKDEIIPYLEGTYELLHKRSLFT